MKHFDQRWQTLARQAATASAAEETAPPPGFVTRVLARARQPVTESWEDAFNALGLRAVVVTAVLGILSAGLAYNEWHQGRIERPALEQSLTEDLPWP